MEDRLLNIKDLINELDMSLYKYLDIHHTWVPNHTSFSGSNHFRLQNSMRNYHINTRGWRDIAQHVSLAPDGKFITGRDFTWTPVSIRYNLNKGAFMVEMIGNFDIGHDKLEGKQLESILLLIKHFIDNGKEIRFHREYSSKTCPGSSLDKNEMIRMANNMGKNLKDWQIEMGVEAIKELANDGIIDDADMHIQNLKIGKDMGWLNLEINKRINDKINNLVIGVDNN